MSFTQLGYPSAFASEGNPLAGGFDPWIHGVHDTMNVDTEHGYFSLDVSPVLILSENFVDSRQHMARFSELAIAFAIEQGGWDNTWR
jgi:leucyl aminopeptidase